MSSRLSIALTLAVILILATALFLFAPAPSDQARVGAEECLDKSGNKVPCDPTVCRDSNDNPVSCDSLNCVAGSCVQRTFLLSLSGPEPQSLVEFYVSGDLASILFAGVRAMDSIRLRSGAVSYGYKSPQLTLKLLSGGTTIFNTTISPQTSYDILVPLAADIVSRMVNTALAKSGLRLNESSSTSFNLSATGKGWTYEVSFVGTLKSVLSAITKMQLEISNYVAINTSFPTDCPMNAICVPDYNGGPIGIVLTSNGNSILTLDDNYSNNSQRIAGAVFEFIGNNIYGAKSVGGTGTGGNGGKLSTGGSGGTGTGTGTGGGSTGGLQCTLNGKPLFSQALTFAGSLQSAVDIGVQVALKLLIGDAVSGTVSGTGVGGGTPIRVERVDPGIPEEPILPAGFPGGPDYGSNDPIFGVPDFGLPEDSIGGTQPIDDFTGGDFYFEPIPPEGSPGGPGY